MRQAVQYLSPRTLAEALELLHAHAGYCKPYAGGTDLMVQLRDGAAKTAAVQYLMDLQHLPELFGIQKNADSITVGAMETHARIARDPVILACARPLALAASQVGSPQVRNRGTVGGNVANASAAAGTLSPLARLNATAELASVRGVRGAAPQELYTPQGKSALAPDELILRFQIDQLDGWATAFTKLGRRKALAISRLNTAVALRSDAGRITDARIAPGCVFAAPDRVPAAEQLLIGQAPSDALFAQAAEADAQEMIARTGVRWSTAYKQPALTAVVVQTLHDAWEMAK